MKNKVICTIVIILLSCILVYYLFIKQKGPMQKNNCFYEVSEVEPQLNLIHAKRDMILAEVNNIKSPWHDWPERDLYEKKDGEWKIFPFYAFGIWVPQNCQQCPTICQFLQNIPGLKLATLSKLSPGMRLTPHQGWGNHSNNVIRCHYGIDIPENCYVGVESEKKYHHNDEWVVFDDSKTHYAVNDSNQARIVLIVDVDRPTTIRKGNSQVGDSRELIEIVNYFKYMKEMNPDTKYNMPN